VGEAVEYLKKHSEVSGPATEGRMEGLPSAIE